MNYQPDYARGFPDQMGMNPRDVYSFIPGEWSSNLARLFKGTDRTSLISLPRENRFYPSFVTTWRDRESGKVVGAMDLPSYLNDGGSNFMDGNGHLYIFTGNSDEPRINGWFDFALSGWSIQPENSKYNSAHQLIAGTNKWATTIVPYRMAPVTEIKEIGVDDLVSLQVPLELANMTTSKASLILPVGSDKIWVAPPSEQDMANACFIPIIMCKGTKYKLDAYKDAFSSRKGDLVTIGFQDISKRYNQDVEKAIKAIIPGVLYSLFFPSSLGTCPKPRGVPALSTEDIIYYLKFTGYNFYDSEIRLVEVPARSVGNEKELELTFLVPPSIIVGPRS